jgi:hypothetical protein
MRENDGTTGLGIMKCRYQFKKKITLNITALLSAVKYLNA